MSVTNEIKLDPDRQAYFNHWSHKGAAWFNNEYFVWGRKFVSLKNSETIKLSQNCYSLTELVGLESWASYILRIVSIASVIIPIIGGIYIKADQYAFKAYQKTESFIKQCNQWEEFFLEATLKSKCSYSAPYWRLGQSNQDQIGKDIPYLAYQQFVTALARSDLDPQIMPFKHIVARQSKTDAMYFFGPDGPYNTILDEKNIQHSEVLAFVVHDFANYLEKNLTNLHKRDTNTLGKMTLCAIPTDSFNPKPDPSAVNCRLSKCLYEFLATLQKNTHSNR